MTKLKSVLLNLFLFSLFSIVSVANSHAQSYSQNHSYLLTDTGRIHTVRAYMPESNFIPLFSPDGYFLLPEMIAFKRSNYILDKDNNIFTVDADGYVYQYNYSTEIGSKLKNLGGTFFTTKSKELHIVKSNGAIETLKKKDIDFDSSLKLFGGNFILTRKGTVYIVDSINGRVMSTNFTIKAKIVKTVGNNFLITEEGQVYSFGIKEDGSVSIKTKYSSNFKRVVRSGGNFFIDGSRRIYTISTAGEIIRVLNPKKDVLPNKIGTNYFSYANGDFYIVDNYGAIHFLTNFAERISTTSY